MKKDKDPCSAIEVIKRAYCLIEKQKEKLPPSSQLRVLLSDCTQVLKDLEKRLAKSTLTMVKAGIEFGPKVELHGQAYRLIVDLRTKLWMKLSRRYNLKCKSGTSGKELEKI